MQRLHSYQNIYLSKLMTHSNWNTTPEMNVLNLFFRSDFLNSNEKKNKNKPRPFYQNNIYLEWILLFLCLSICDIWPISKQIEPMRLSDDKYTLRWLIAVFFTRKMFMLNTIFVRLFNLSLNWSVWMRMNFLHWIFQQLIARQVNAEWLLLIYMPISQSVDSPSNLTMQHLIDPIKVNKSREKFKLQLIFKNRNIPQQSEAGIIKVSLCV